MRTLAEVRFHSLTDAPLMREEQRQCPIDPIYTDAGGHDPLGVEGRALRGE
jgi:hypothetical protein